MTRNVGDPERIVRAIAGIALILCAVLLPLPLVARATAFGGMGVYLLVTSLAGTCLGYKLMGRSTCARG
jgi:hypothetical protein